MLSYFLDNKEHLLTKEQIENLEQDMVKFGHWNVYMWFESPRIRISKIEVEGPLNDAWPPESHRAIFSDEPYRPEAAGDVLQRFATRGLARRPVTDAEVAPLTKLVSTVLETGQPPEAAIKEGLKATLCSPEFLYREEQADRLNGQMRSRRGCLIFFGRRCPTNNC